MRDKISLWTRYSKYRQYFGDIGIALDVSRMRFSESFLDDMAELASRAFNEMKALEGGAIANKDEQRMVGHYWLRNPTLAPNDRLRDDIAKVSSQVKKFVEGVRAGAISGTKAAKKFTRVLLVGIGGSALGPQLVCDALRKKSSPINMDFLDNTDPDGILRILQAVESELELTLVLVISKSGKTAETHNGYLHVKRYFEQKGLNFSKHAVAITGEGSILDELAKRDSWIARFPMWDWIGGRTSVFSAVGMLPAALLGVSTEDFLAGGAAMDEVTRVEDVRKNPAMMLALMWYFAGSGRGLRDMVILPYKDRLVLLSKYLQQLVMESLGKERNRRGEVVNQGIAVYGNKGSTDQHAYVQQLRDGVDNFFVTFIQVLSDVEEGDGSLRAGGALHVEPDITAGDYLNGFMFGTRSALYENGRDSITITIRDLSPKSLGALISLYERAVGYYASLVDINAYHQPGVEAGKLAAGRVIKLQQESLARLREEKCVNKSFTAMELAEMIKQREEVEAIYFILEHLAANAREGITQVDGETPDNARFTFFESSH